MSAAIQSAYCKQTIINDVGAACRTADISFKEMIEVRIVQHRRDLRGNVGPDVGLGRGDLFDEFFPSIDE